MAKLKDIEMLKIADLFGFILRFFLFQNQAENITFFEQVGFFFLLLL